MILKYGFIALLYFSGIPKLKIPPLDPFSLPKMSMNRRSDSLNLKTTMTQLNVTGLTKVRVSKLK